MRWTIVAKPHRISFLMGQVNEFRLSGEIYTLHRHGEKGWIVHRKGGDFHVYSAGWITVRNRWNELLLDLRK